MLVLQAALALGRSAAIGWATGGSGFSTAVVGAAFDQLTASLRAGVWTIAISGLLVGAVSYLAGRRWSGQALPAGR
jgi:hypothetical protein